MQKLVVFTMLSLLASGCASIGNLNTAFRTNELEENEAVFVDAHQRAVLSNNRPVLTGGVVTTSTNNPGGGWTLRTEPTSIDQHVLCAEPGPDVFAARSAGFSANASNGQASGGLTGSTGESAGQLSAPTTAILSQRHAYYRICEAYMNGVGDDIDYMIGIRSNQRDLPTLLAIEQLTGAVRAAPAVLSSGSTVTSGQILSHLTSARAQEAARLDRYEARIAEIDRANTRDRAIVVDLDRQIGAATGTAKDDLTRQRDDVNRIIEARTAEKTRLDASMTQTRTAIAALDQQIAQAEEASSTTTAQGITFASASSTTISPETAEHISNAIVRIVEMSNSRDFGPTTCLAILRRPSPPAGDVLSRCNDILDAYVGALEGNADAQTAFAEIAQSIVASAQGRPLSADEIALIRDLIRASPGSMTAILNTR